MSSGWAPTARGKAWLCGVASDTPAKSTGPADGLDPVRLNSGLPRRAGSRESAYYRFFGRKSLATGPAEGIVLLYAGRSSTAASTNLCVFPALSKGCIWVSSSTTTSRVTRRPGFPRSTTCRRSSRPARRRWISTPCTAWDRTAEALTLGSLEVAHEQRPPLHLR